jgi:hypothetical protein
MVVIVDADTKPLKARSDALAQALRQARLDPRAAEEPIAIFVPKRNIETWIRFVGGEVVDEVTDYSYPPRPADYDVAAGRLREMCQRGLGESAPPSLHAACAEITRIAR